MNASEDATPDQPHDDSVLPSQHPTLEMLRRLLDSAERIRREMTGWPGVTTAAGEYGETDFVVDGRSLGHVHGGHQADIPFPRRIRDELVAVGRIGPHHVHPDSGWTTLYIRTDADAQEAIELLRINYDRIIQRAEASARGRPVGAPGRPAAGR